MKTSNTLSVPTVAITMGNVDCSPYAVQLTAAANQPGTYTWSNGMSGANIAVDHGGPYRVRFKPEGADCEAVATYTVPKSPDEFTWVFPTGCFSYCKGSGNFPYLVSPLPSFAGYHYDLNGNTVSGGSGVVPDLVFADNIDGALTLSLGNGYCTAVTQPYNVSLQNCSTCKIRVKITKTLEIQDPGGFVYYQIIGGGILNQYNIPITVHLSSADGGFSPAAISIAAGGTYLFANNPVDFIPNTPNPGIVSVAYTVSGNTGGKTKFFAKSIWTSTSRGWPDYGTAARVPKKPQ